MFYLHEAIANKISRHFHSWLARQYSVCASIYDMISSLPGNALRTLLELRGFPCDSTYMYVLEGEPGTLNFKRRKPSIL